MTDVDDYMTMLKELQLKRTVVIEDVDKIILENKQLKEEVSRESYKVSEAYCYVEELKELLKECRPYIALYTENNKHIGFTPETANLLQRIKEVLK